MAYLVVQVTVLVEFLKSIPDVIWSGVIASMLTLGGVLISNRSNTNRLKLQLQHDSNEKTKERTLTLRREVYMRTAEELVKVNAHLAALPQIDSTKTNIGEGLQGFLSAAARLQLVAEPKTALLVGQLASEYGELFFRLMTHLIPASKAKIDIQIADDLSSKTQTEIARVLSEQARLNESERPDPQAFQALRRTFEFHQTRAAQFSDDRTAAWKAFNRDNVNFQRYLLTQLRDISPKQISVIVEIRRDLGLSSNLDEIEAQMKQQWVRMEANFDALIAALGDEGLH